MRSATWAPGLVAVLALTGVLAGCAREPAPAPTVPPPTATPSVAHAGGTPFPDPIPDVPMTPCPGIEWPPAGTDPGETITVNWWYGSVVPGGLHVQVTNRTSRSFLVLFGDPPNGAEDGPEECRVHSPWGAGGRVRAGSTLEFPVLPVGRQVGIYVFTGSCPEGCRKAAIGWMSLNAPG